MLIVAARRNELSVRFGSKDSGFKTQSTTYKIWTCKFNTVGVEFCKSTINEFCKDSKHYLQDLCKWKKNHNASNIRSNDRLYLVAADVCALYPSIERETVKMALE